MIRQAMLRTTAPYGYDAENRLVSVDGGATATYIHDHRNRRLRKPGIHYVWDGSLDLLGIQNAC
jgi:hypothetical protein